MVLRFHHLEAHMTLSLLLWRMGANVFQGSQNGSWNGRGCGQMSSLRMETILISSIGQLDQLAVGIVVRRWAARILATHALLLLGYAIGGLVAILIAAILPLVALELTYFGGGIEGIRTGLGNGQEGYGQDVLNQEKIGYYKSYFDWGGK